MRPVVSMVQMDQPGPFLYHGVHGLNGERLLRLAARKKMIVIPRPDFLQVVSKGFVDELIDHEDVLLPRLIFLYGDELSGFKRFYVLYLHQEKVAGTKTVIYSHGKKQQIPWRPGQKLFYRLNVFASPDGIHADLSSFFGMIGVSILFHHASFRITDA